MSIKPEAGLMRKIPAGYVKKFEALPCTFEGNGRVLVVSTKTPRHIIDEMMRITGIGKYDTMPPKDVQKLIDEAYDTLSGPTDPPEAAPTDTCDGEPSSMIEVEGYPMKDCDEGSITQFVDSMFERTIRLKASDMHLEPHEKEFVVRNRIDGVLHNVVNLPRELHAPVIARVKAMAGLDIAEKRLPQDGRINVSIGGSATDMQVSIVPTSFGERAVLRVRNRTGILGEVAHYFKKLFDEEASTPPTEESPLAREGNVEDVLRESFSPDSPAGKPGFAPPQPSANDAGTTPPSAPEKQRDRADPGKEIVSQIVQKNIFRSRYLRPEEQKSAALSSVKGMLRKWDCQEVPASLFDFASFRERYGTKGALEVLIGIDEEKVKERLPKISSVSTGYMVGGKLPRVDFDIVAFGFRNREYTEEALVIWAGDFISGKVLPRGKLEHFENRCRLLSLEKSLGSGQLVKWVLFDGTVDADTLAYASSCGICLTHTKQLKILFNLFDVDETLEEERMEAREAPHRAEREAGPLEFDLVIPMREDAEIIAAKVVEEISHFKDVERDTVDKIKMAIIEACINAFEHSEAEEGLVKLRYIIADDKLEVFVADEGKGFKVVKSPEKKEEKAKTRGWGLKIIKELVDEVEILTGERGTTIRMVKYLDQPSSDALDTDEKEDEPGSHTITEGGDSGSET